MKPSAESATLIAWLWMQEGHRASHDQIRAALGVGPYRYGKAVAAARAHGLITISKGVLELTDKALGILAA